MKKNRILFAIAVFLGVLPLAGVLACVFWAMHVEGESLWADMAWVYRVAGVLFGVGVVVYFYAARAFRKKPTTTNIVLILFGLVTTGFLCRIFYYLYNWVDPFKQGMLSYGTCYWTAAVRSKTAGKKVISIRDLVVVDDHVRKRTAYLAYERHDNRTRPAVNEDAIRDKYHALVESLPEMGQEQIAEALAGDGIVAIYMENKSSEQNAPADACSAAEI